MNSYRKTLFLNTKKAWRARIPQGIICHPYKFIYFPIPKVACTSTKSLIADLCELEQKIDPHYIDFEFVSSQQLENFQDYFCFTIVRNPWSRIVSCYKNKIQQFSKLNNGLLFYGFERYNKILPIGAFDSDMSFEKFVKVISLIPDYLSDEHFRSQTSLIPSQKGKLLVDRVSKLEELDRELRLIFKNCGIDNIKMPYINKSNFSDSNYRDYYNTELKERVARRYRSDIETFGYTF